MNVETTISCALGLADMAEAARLHGKTKSAVYQAVCRVRPLIAEYEDMMAGESEALAQIKCVAALAEYVSMVRGGMSKARAFMLAGRTHAVYAQELIDQAGRDLKVFL